MKKLLLLSLAMFIGVVMFAQNKTTMSPQEREQMGWKSTMGTWAEAGMFVSTDINSVEHDLAAYLAAGKTVIIDFSAIWCAPCWNLHQSGVFDDLHNTYGPEGTDELVVLWIECDGGTLAEVQGVGADTQGDWTEGGTWPVPIILGTSEINGFAELYEGYVPTVFMVCPSGYYKDVTEQCWTNADAVYAELGTCPAAGQAPVAEIAGPATGYVNNDLEFSNSGISVDPITGYAWTFENGSIATSTIAMPTVSWSAAGEYEVTLIVSNANGASDLVSMTVNIVDPGDVNDLFVTFEEILVETTFPSDFAPYNWTVADVDLGTVWGDFSEFGVTGAANSFNCYSQALGAQEWTPYAGDKCGFAMTNNPGAGNGSANNDWFISPLIQLGTGSSFSLYVRSTNTTWGLEKYKIAVSTTTNAPASFTVLGAQATAPADWTLVTKDLSAYNGQEIYIAVNYVGTDTYYFIMDDLQVTTTITGTNDISAYEVSVFPNPATDELNINYAAGASIKIYNNLGQVVLSLENASDYNKIDVSSLEAGSYFVNVTKDNVTKNHKIMLVK